MALAKLTPHLLVTHVCACCVKVTRTPNRSRRRKKWALSTIHWLCRNPHTARKGLARNYHHPSQPGGSSAHKPTWWGPGLPFTVRAQGRHRRGVPWGLQAIITEAYACGCAGVWGGEETSFPLYLPRWGPQSLEDKRLTREKSRLKEVTGKVGLRDS